MKKVLSLILVLILCLSLCACGSNDTKNIESELQGCWVVDSTEFSRSYCFDDGEFESVVFNVVGRYEFEGTYSVGKKDITLIKIDPETGENNGSTEKLPYTYNKDSGKLRLFWFDGKTELFREQ